MLIRRAIAAMLLVPTLACTTLSPVASVRQYIETEQPSRIYVVHRDAHLDARTSVLERPAVANDHLTGVFAGTFTQASFSLPDVLEVRVRRVSPARTAGLIGIVAAGVGFVVYEATRSNFDPNAPDLTGAR